MAGFALECVADFIGIRSQKWVVGQFETMVEA